MKLLGGADPWTYPWHRLRYRDTARVRAQLVERYAPATVNKILSALRGVLKTCWRLGLVDAETYARAADVGNVRAKTLPSGRAVVGRFPPHCEGGYERRIPPRELFDTVCLLMSSNHWNQGSGNEY